MVLSGARLLRVVRHGLVEIREKVDEARWAEEQDAAGVSKGAMKAQIVQPMQRRLGMRLEVRKEAAGVFNG